jgi:putative Mg2+ transporter-C (MgtC) family protein
MEIDLETILRLVLAAVLGGFIGLEREIHGRPAGFRTHLLVSLGSCVFTVVSIYFYKIYGVTGTRGLVSIDPGRVAAQVVTGIGFLGAGAILREKASIRGLTTAACLWVASAIGVACGVGLFAISAVVTVTAIASLLMLKKVEGVLNRDTYSAIKVWSMDLEGQLAKFEQLVQGFNLRMLNASVERDLEKQEFFLEFEIKLVDREVAYRMLDAILATPGVKRVRLE